MISTLLILAGLFAQQRETPWVIHLNDKDGTRIVAYGDESDFEKDIFTVSEVKPWASSGSTRTLFKKDVKGHYPAGSAELAAYYAEGWKANGGIQIETPHGKQWVFEEEYELAQRAAEMASVKEEERAVSSPAKPVAAADPAPVERSLGFGQLWGAHVAVLTVGLGLSVLVVWFLVLE